jgi:hypothetical protein
MALAVLGLVLAACGDEPPSASSSSLSTSSVALSATTTAPAGEVPDSLDGELMEISIPDEGMTVADALNADAGPIVVYGQLFDDGQGLRLCSGLTRSLPPICVGEPLLVDGLALVGVALEDHEGTMWSTDAVVLEGVIDGNTLRDSRMR